MQRPAAPIAGQRATVAGHPSIVATTARKPKVRRIDSSEKFKRLSHQDLLAHYLSARKARMITAIAIIVFIAWFLIFLFQPSPDYRLSDGGGLPIGTPEYVRMLEALADAHFDPHSSVEVLPNGE